MARVIGWRRIDVLVDQLLGHRIRPEATRSDEPRAEQLLGKVAIANAKLAYQSFKRIFNSERWQALAEQGARVQRPLWASTSTKDPLYDDVRYVKPLIGPYTVNTMPDETIDAFAEHGVIRQNSVEAELEEAGHPVVHIRLPEAIALGGEFFRWEVATAMAGAIMGINAFDEPNVAESKQHTLDLPSARQRQGAASQEPPILEADGTAIYGDARQWASWRAKADSVRAFLQAWVCRFRRRP